MKKGFRQPWLTFHKIVIFSNLLGRSCGFDFPQNYIDYFVSDTVDVFLCESGDNMLVLKSCQRQMDVRTVVGNHA